MCIADLLICTELAGLRLLDGAQVSVNVCMTPTPAERHCCKLNGLTLVSQGV